MSVWRDIWHDVRQPSSDDESAYLFALIAFGHAMLGALLVCFLPVWAAVIVYAFGKELPDYACRDGSLIDGILDIAFVGLGACFFILPNWPVFVWVAVALAIWILYR